MDARGQARARRKLADQAIDDRRNCVGPISGLELEPAGCQTGAMNLHPYTQQSRRKIAETATAMLGGHMSFIEGARWICALRFEAKLPDFDPDITPFVAIASETDTLPLGEARQLWAPDALAKLQPEIDKAEHWARNVGYSPCQKLIARFTASENNVNP
jgi:hypothetical protein